MGRPSTYSPERGAAICKRLSEGESLSTICNDANQPTRQGVYKWLEKYPEFVDAYARARDLYADFVFDGLFDLASSATPQDVQCVRLQIDTRKWALARMSPKKYGDRAALELSGADGGPISIVYDKAFEGV